MQNYLGHSANALGFEELLCEHLERVVRYAAVFGKSLGLENESVYTALLHDVGKIGDCYQQRLRGMTKHVDHWSFGAYLAKKYGKNEAAPAVLAIGGHHIGLGKFSDASNIDPALPCEPLNLNLNLSAPASCDECDQFLNSLAIDPRTIPASGQCLFERNGQVKRAASMADVRMLYSVLVDADFLATEGHFHATAEQQYYTRPQSPPLCPDKAFESLQKFLTGVKENAHASEKIIRMRNQESPGNGPSGQETPP